MEPCGTSTFKTGTFMWNPVEPHLLKMEEPGARFRAAAPNPDFLFKKPKLLKLLGNIPQTLLTFFVTSMTVSDHPYECGHRQQSEFRHR